MVAGEDFWKTVLEFGLMSRERAEEGIVRVTEEAKTLLEAKIPKDKDNKSAMKRETNLAQSSNLKIIVNKEMDLVLSLGMN